MANGRHDCIVIGGGPAGLAAAACLALSGLDVAVAAAVLPGRAMLPAEAEDARTAALFPPAIALLERLGAWAQLAGACAPLRAIRIVDATGNILRAPEVAFEAMELGRTDLGHNVPNRALTEALATSAKRLGATLLDAGRVAAVTLEQGGAEVALADGRCLGARLVVAADGRESLAREAAGIGVQRWSHAQAALASRFRHSRPHGGVSTELHGRDGPCTTVPLPGNASSLVWMDRCEAIDRLAAATPEDFLAALGRRLGGLLGTLSDAGPRRSFPLAGLIADRMAANRVALVGEAGHALPPIGAQGLNLGLADAAVLAEIIGAAHAAGQDIGGAMVLEAYHMARAGDVRRRAGAVDLLNRSVGSVLWPLNLARGAGLHVLAASPALRRSLMHQGLYPPQPLPRLMRAAP